MAQKKLEPSIELRTHIANVLSIAGLAEGSSLARWVEEQIMEVFRVSSRMPRSKRKEIFAAGEARILASLNENGRATESETQN